ncbi:hypothetical protein [Methylobacterium fujisawaense]
MYASSDPGGLAELLRECSRLCDRREELVRTEAETVRDVGLAKGRQQLRPAIEAFVEQLQADAHRRNVGSYETLLSLIAKEVIPTAGAIGLDLSVKRSLPALDIFVRKAGGGRSDIFEDQGGALTNAVSTGLRLIASVKSGRRKLVVLDETDCWIKPDRVRSYLKVVHETSSELALQTILISHHDPAFLPEGVPLSRVEGVPESEEGVRIENDPRRHAWLEDEPGMRFIRMRNVQSHADAVLHLCPGVTAVCGDNNLGKSIVNRALRAAFHGEGREGLVRDRGGAQEAVVEIGLERGRILRYVRRLKGNPIQSWTLLEADGSVHDGCDGGGRDVPAWVAEKVGIADDEHHFQRQKLPTFLLDRSPSERASVLSIGRESELIRVMQDLHKGDVTEDSRTVREGEKSIAALRERIARLSGVEAMAAEAEGLRTAADALRAEAEGLRAAENDLSALVAARARASVKRSAQDVLARMPDASLPEAIAFDMDATAACAGRAAALIEIRARGEVARARTRLLAGLPAEAPQLEDGGECEALVRSMLTARVRAYVASVGSWVRGGVPEPVEIAGDAEIEADVARLVQARAAAAAGKAALDDVRTRLEANAEACSKAIEALGGLCPTCGNGLGDASHFLAHEVEAAA